MINKIKELLIKYKSFVLYAVFGVLTTIVNIASYWVLAHPFGLLDRFGTFLPNSIAWVISCTFAYITNRIWVFVSENKDKLSIIKEVIYFYSCRLATLGIDVLVMFIFVDKLGFNDLIFKFIANVIVIIVNYIFSKLVIFKKHTKKET